jgi:Apea-like HEPN
MEDVTARRLAIPGMELRGGGWKAAGGGLFRYGLLPEEPALQFMEALQRHRQSEEHRAVVQALRRHPLIRNRLDTLVGTVFSATRTDAEAVPERLVWALDPKKGLSEESFDQAFTEVYRWLIRDREEYLVLAPLLDVDLQSDTVQLGSELEIDRLNDDEVAACLTAQVIPTWGSPEITQVSSRTGLRIRECFPVIVGDQRPDGAAVLDEAGTRWSTLIEEAVHVLRLFKPGHVSARGAVGFTPGVGAYHGFPIAHASPNVPSGVYVVSASEAPLLRTLWEAAQSNRVRRIKPLQIALRRFGFGGERIRSEDRLIDLVIAAEAVFLAGEHQESAHKLALRSALMLGGIVGQPNEIFRTMKRAYDARSKVAHGSAVPELKFANGEPASLDDYVELVSAYMRTALKSLIMAAAKKERLPIGKWDDLVLDRIGPEPDVSQ